MLLLKRVLLLHAHCVVDTAQRTEVGKQSVIHFDVCICLADDTVKTLI
jgi:hypothetical protein